MTPVVAVRNGVIITSQRPALPALADPAAERPLRALAPDSSTASVREPGPLTAIALAEECSRLRRDNQRLLDDNVRLRADITRLSSPQLVPREPDLPLDDSARRFALLELE